MKKQMICQKCGTAGRPKKITKGSFFVELFLWCFVVPGILYSVWRIATRYKACPICMAEHMVKLDSPYGQRLLKEHNPGIVNL
jgi:hypothetical protein